MLISNYRSQLVIKKLPVFANIGAFSYEVGQKQKILLDIKIDFITPPLGAASDQLSDVHCYKTLIEELIIFIDTRHFNLIEHLTSEILRLLKSRFAKELISVKVTKFPVINNQEQAVSFSVTA